MSNDVNDVTPSRGEASTLYVAVEVSDKAWQGYFFVGPVIGTR